MGLAFDTRRGTDELLERDEALATLAEALNDARLGHGSDRARRRRGRSGQDDARARLLPEARPGRSACSRRVRRALDAAAARAAARRGDRSASALAGALEHAAHARRRLRRPASTSSRSSRPCSCSRICTGATRRPSTSCGCSPAGWTCRRSSSRPIATTASTATIRCGCSSAISRRRRAVGRLDAAAALARGGRASWRSGTKWTSPISTRAPAATRSSSRRCSRPGGRECRRPSATPSSPAPPGLSHDALEVLETVALVAAARRALAARRRCPASASAHLDECVATGLVTGDDDAVAFRHELARAAVEDAMPPTRRLGAAAADPRRALRRGRAARSTRPGSRTTPRLRATSTRCSSSPRRPPRARARPGAYREAAAQYARALRVGGATLPPGGARSCSRAAHGPATSPTTSSRRSPSSARRSRAGARRARPRTRRATSRSSAATSSAAGCSATPRRRWTEATRLIAGQEESAEVAFVEAYRSVMTVDRRRPRGRRRARPAGAGDGAPRPATPGPPSNALVTDRHDRAAARARGRPRDPARGRRGGARERASPSSTRGRSTTSAASASRHLTTSSRTRTSPRRSSSASRTTRISGGSTRSRSRRGTRSTAVAGPRRPTSPTRLLQDPRESPWPHHEALVVLALVRARRGDPGATAALDEAEAIGVPPDDVDAHVDLAAARAEVAWLEQRPDAVAEATAAHARGRARARRRRGRGPALVLASACGHRCRSAGGSGGPVCARTPGRVGPCREGVARGRHSPTRRRSRSSRRATRARCGRRSR